MALCRLECPICQQNLLKNDSDDNDLDHETEPFREGGGDEDELSLRMNQDILSQGDSRGRRHQRHAPWSWTPVSTACGHLFHKGCIMEWFRCRRHYEGSSRLRGSCPTCRKPIACYNLVRVYLTPASLEAEPAIGSSPSSATSSISGTSDLSPTSTARHAILQDDERMNPDSLLPESEQGNSNNSGGRYYNDFYNLDSGRRPDRHDLLRLRMRLRRASRLDELGLDCDNPECMDLRNAFLIMTRECKALQRRLNLELDVSKMKSILVASQQRDIDKLKLLLKTFAYFYFGRRRRRFPEKNWLFIVGYGVILSVWLTICIGMVFTVVTGFGRSKDKGESYVVEEEL